MKPLPGLGRSRRALAVGVLLLTALVAQSGATATATAFAATGAPSAPPASSAPQQSPAAPTGPCPTALDPQGPVGCQLGDGGTADLALTLPRDQDLVIFQVTAPFAGGALSWKLLAPDGSTVACENLDRPTGVFRCATGPAGGYTFELHNAFGNTALSVAYLPLLSTAACRQVTAEDSRLGTAGLFGGSLGAGAVGDCYTTAFAPGEVVRTYAPTGGVAWTVYDGAGRPVCDAGPGPNGADHDLTCTLTGSAPYRVTVQNGGTARDYTFGAGRLSHPEGCAAVAPQGFGDPLDRSSAARCRTLTAPTAGRYLYGAASASGAALSGRLYRPDGAPESCRGEECELGAGEHTWVLDGAFGDIGGLGLGLYSAAETRGCTAAADDGLVSGAVTGTGTAGQYRCLTLPTATGKGLYLLDRPPADGAPVIAQVEDANGVAQCASGGSPYTVCKLTGTAPFRALLAGAPGKAYALVIHRTDNGAGCTAWPQSGSEGSAGAQVALTAAVQQQCLSIPADRHSALELLAYTDTEQLRSATVHVNDGAGNPLCADTGYSLRTCRLTPGTAYTAMLVGTGRSDTYRSARYDVSPSAPCTAPASTRVGGPSTPLDFGAVLEAHCVRVSGAATDKFLLNGRTDGGWRGDSTTQLIVLDADGKAQCEWQTFCRVTGSTSYVALVTPAGYRSGPAEVHPTLPVRVDVDAWKVGGANGWAPECAANPLSPDGFPQRSGVLTESVTAYCGVIDLKAKQSVSVRGSSSTGDNSVPYFDFAGPDTWTGVSQTYSCVQDPGSAFGAYCTNSGATAGQAVLILDLHRSAAPLEYTVVGGPLYRLGTPQGISPAAAPAGTLVQAVIRGTGLSMAGGFTLKQTWRTFGRVTPVSASEDGSTLNVLVDATGLEPGSYDLVRAGIDYTEGLPSPGYLPKAFTLTAAAAPPARSRFVPVTPARFLDTRDGTGAPKARVTGGGVVPLQVTGVKGVPATGVTAVVMNVTAVDPSEDGHVTVYPDGQPVPSTSSVNFAAHTTVPNLVTVPVVNGRVDLRNNSGAVDLIADVTGYYTDAADQGSAFTSITPARFLDTRDGTGAPKARVGAGGTVALQVAGVKGVPATGVTAVVMNVTAVDPSEDGHVTVYPDGQPLPNVSNLNFTPGRIVPNLVTVPVVNGRVDLRNNSGSVDLIADVTGYYAATGSTFSAAVPQRLLDTRYGLGARAGTVGPDGIVSFQVQGFAGMPASGVTAVVLNVTVTGPTDASHLIAYQHGRARPGVSNLNYVPGQTVSNLVVVPVVDGRVTLYNHSGDVQVIADLNGYFTS